MRVIAGSAKGTRLKVPQRVTRPSTDRLREALFSILGHIVPDAKVLDLFAGSGALGIEALSRGAQHVTFVENNGGAVRTIQENLSKGRMTESQYAVLNRDVFAAVGTLRKTFDLVLADPPYASKSDSDLAAELLASSKLPPLLSPAGLLSLEVETEREAPTSEAWELRDRRTYGSSAILFYGLRSAQ